MSQFICSHPDDVIGMDASGLHCPRCQPRLYLHLKLALEMCAATALLVICAPLLLLLAALVKLTSRGPALYSQVRLGRGGTPFRILKLRTMTHNCESDTGAVWAQKNDPRVTRVGRFLRDTHLDELPQLWNVLRREMSLIGPRPERPEIAARLHQMLPEYDKRLLLRPGMTGLAQVRLPGDRDIASVRRKLRRDLYYVRHVGPLLDFRIAVATVLHVSANAARSLAKMLVISYDAGISRDAKQDETADVTSLVAAALPSESAIDKVAA